MNELDLHADAEGWSDNLDEARCPACGGPRVVFIPCWADGGGILTAEEIDEILESAELRVLELGRMEVAGELPPVTTALTGDVVMTIEGYRDGSFKAVIIDDRTQQPRTAHDARNSRIPADEHQLRLRAAMDWRKGLVISSRVREITQSEDREEGVRVFLGEPGVLNFAWRSRLREDRKSTGDNLRTAAFAYSPRNNLADRTRRSARIRRRGAVSGPPGGISPLPGQDAGPASG